MGPQIQQCRVRAKKGNQSNRITEIKFTGTETVANHEYVSKLEAMWDTYLEKIRNF